MNSNQTNFECLANETLLQIFEYLDAKKLFRAFENLNHRFNTLIQSVHQPFLILSPLDNNHNFDEEIFSPSIYTLIVQEHAEVIIGYFPNVHRLILHWLPRFVLDKLELNILPHLKYLSIRTRQLPSEGLLADFADKIFTNSFPQLQFCSLPDMSISIADDLWEQTPAIHILKLGSIDLQIYANILSCCPNLRVLEFAVDEWTEIPSTIDRHPNIKTLVIKRVNLNHRILKACLSSVPNLRRLDINATDSSPSPGILYSKIDWLKSAIDLYLPKLRCMNFHLFLFTDLISNVYNDDLLRQLERNFEQIQMNSYQAKLIIHRNQFIDRF